MRFLIDPVNLCISNRRIIGDQVLKILTTHDIQLSLDIEIHPGKLASSPTIVLIHGNSTSKIAFQEQADFYAKIGYRVISFDLLGHGNSSKIGDINGLSEQEKDLLAEAFYNPYALIAEVKQLLMAYQIYAAHMVGWSLGGHIAYGIAIEQPELVVSISTIGAPPVKFNHEGLRTGFHSYFLQFVEQWITKPNHFSKAQAEDLVIKGWGYAEINDSNRYLVNDLIKTDPLFRKFLFLNIDKYQVPALNGESFIRNTQIPVCLIVAQNDNGINASYFERLRGVLKHRDSEVMIVEKGGHALMKSYSLKITVWLNKLAGIKQAVASPFVNETTSLTPSKLDDSVVIPVPRL